MELKNFKVLKILKFCKKRSCASPRRGRAPGGGEYARRRRAAHIVTCLYTFPLGGDPVLNFLVGVVLELAAASRLPVY